MADKSHSQKWCNYVGVYLAQNLTGKQLLGQFIYTEAAETTGYS